ncbi:MAG: dockerin type I repeat-containing protein, partial [Clostridiales bacterium]|nr:dockerin type I repeat-containing protein [Clostridiales bacterium]
SVIPAGENTYLDTDAEPGKLYWYTFTVVLSDFTESKPAGKVSCRSADTINPTVYHTPVNQGYAQNNLVISCTARDNISIDNVKLYYRTSGETAWKTLTMAKQNDKFSATVFGSDVTLAGLEYYIVVSDGRNEVNKGTAEAPYSVVVKDASALSTYGDVDGDGAITTKDALMLIEAINGDLLLTDDQFKRADLNKDKELSSAEALRILQYINGKVTVLEM